MADGIDIEFVGWDRLDQMMADLGPAITRQCVTKGVWEAAQFLKAEMKSRCPVGVAYDGSDPGELRDSIDVVPVAYKKDRPDQVRASISPTYEKKEGEQSPGYYCRFVEYGSKHNPHPQPFMRPTIDEAGEAAINLCISTVAQELETMSMEHLSAAPTEPAS